MDHELVFPNVRNKAFFGGHGPVILIRSMLYGANTSCGHHCKVLLKTLCLWIIV